MITCIAEAPQADYSVGDTYLFGRCFPNPGRDLVARENDGYRLGHVAGDASKRLVGLF